MPFFCCPNKALCTTQAISQPAWCKRQQSHRVPLPVLRGKSHGKCLLAVPGPIWFWTPQPVSHQDLKCVSLPLHLHFLWKPSIFGKWPFPAFHFHKKAGSTMSQDSPALSSPALPWPEKTSQSFTMPYWEGAAHRWETEVLSPEGLRAGGCLWGQTEHNGTKMSLPKGLGITLGLSWRTSWHSCGSLCDTPEYVTPTGVCVNLLQSRDTRGCRTELRANASMGWAKKGVWWASPT